MADTSTTSPSHALISASALAAALASPHPPVVLDTSFDLADPGAGERAYLAGHIPGAQYAHLEHDLSGPKTGADGRFGGRHPLPERNAFAATLGRWGITPGRLVVVADRQGGMTAARGWWLLRWMGHGEVAVLDGGMAAWLAHAGAVETTVSALPAAPPYPAAPVAMPTIDADTLRQQLGQVKLIDARAGERYRGEVEPLDQRAGHIPGARNRFFKDNLQADGRFKPAAQLRAELEPLCAGPAGHPVVQQCGSGVTACHNLLALEVAGLGGSVLYPGSWSEWSSDPTRPVAVG